jgi:hypothetical protein
VTQPIVVTFYTDQFYADKASTLGRSVKRHGLDFVARHLDDTGSWVTNCAMKPAFIRGMFEECSTPVLWMDADSEMVGSPARILETTADLAVHGSNAGQRVRRQAGRKDAVRLPPKWRGKPIWANTGTVFVNQTMNALDLLDAWCMHQDDNARWYDQWTLMYAIADVPDAKIDWLPNEYCAMPIHRGRPASPIIRQEFASVQRRVDRS